MCASCSWRECDEAEGYFGEIASIQEFDTAQVKVPHEGEGDDRGVSKEQ